MRTPRLPWPAARLRARSRHRGRVVLVPVERRAAGRQQHRVAALARARRAVRTARCMDVARTTGARPLEDRLDRLGGLTDGDDRAQPGRELPEQAEVTRAVTTSGDQHDVLEALERARRRVPVRRLRIVDVLHAVDVGDELHAMGQPRPARERPRHCGHVGARPQRGRGGGEPVVDVVRRTRGRQRREHALRSDEHAVGDAVATGFRLHRVCRGRPARARDCARSHATGSSRLTISTSPGPGGRRRAPWRRRSPPPCRASRCGPGRR